jgi:hypothetical protein
MTPATEQRLLTLSRHIDYLSNAARRAIYDATRLAHPYRVAQNEEAAYVYAKVAAHQAALVIAIWEADEK